MMIGIKELSSGGFPSPLHIPRNGAVLCLGPAGQILGGGLIRDQSLRRLPVTDAGPDENGDLAPPWGPYADEQVFVHDAWAVSDITMKHWLQAVKDGHAETVFVDRDMEQAVRTTLERFSAAGQQLIRSEVDKRAGVLEAVHAITRANNPLFSPPPTPQR